MALNCSDVFPGMPRVSIDVFVEFAKKYLIASQELTEQQLAEALRQAIASGDFMRCLNRDGGQQITYMPYRLQETLEWKIKALKRILELHKIPIPEVIDSVTVNAL